jgi:hypothetical protein
MIVIDIVGIVIPDMHSILDEKSDIRVSSEKPEKLSHDSLPVDTLGREKWKSILEFEAKLSSEEAIGHIPTSEIFIIDTVFYEISPEIEILLFWMDRHEEMNEEVSFCHLDRSSLERSGEIFLFLVQDFSTSAIASARNDT